MQSSPISSISSFSNASLAISKEISPFPNTIPPCSVYCIKSLREEGIEPVLFWYNPNIHPYTEYKARRDCLIEYSKMKNIELIIDEDYGLDEFFIIFYS